MRSKLTHDYLDNCQLLKKKLIENVMLQFFFLL